MIDLSGDARRDRRPGARRSRACSAARCWATSTTHATPFGLALPSGIISTHRRRRHHARRRARPPHPRRRADDRQPDRGRRRARRRPARAHQRVRAARTCSGRCAAAAATSASSCRSRSRCSEVGDVLAGPTLWPLEAAPRGHARVRHATWTTAPDIGRRLLPVPRGAAGPAVPGGAARAQDVRHRLVRDRPRRDRRASTTCWPAAPPALHGVQRMPFPAWNSAFDGLYPPGHQWYWRADFVKELPTRRSPLHCEHARAAARRCSRACTCTRSTARPARVGAGRHGVGLPRREVRLGVRRRRPGPGERGADPRLDRRLPRGAAPVLDGRRLREHDDGRGPGAGARELPRPLRPARRGQGDLRPGEPLPGQPEHRPAARPGRPARAAARGPPGGGRCSRSPGASSSTSRGPSESLSL